MTDIQIALLVRLRGIIDRYIDDPDLLRSLKADAEPSKVKGVLNEIEMNKNGMVSADDRESIKDIYFHFC